jgi:hypothetical protein
MKTGFNNSQGTKKKKRSDKWASSMAVGSKSFPERGRIVPELREQGILQYRELVIPPGRILDRISEKSVLVLSVLDSRPNIEDVLLRRLTNSKI